MSDNFLNYDLSCQLVNREDDYENFDLKNRLSLAVEEKGNESNDERAQRILLMMEKSNDRINKLLGILNRIP